MENFAQYIAQSYELAKMSEDPSTQNGAVIVCWDYSETETDVVGRGFNHPVVSVDVDKKFVFEHAERVAIYDALSYSDPSWWDCGHGPFEMFSCWAACPDCARGIILSGIKRLVIHKERMLLTPDRWKEPVEIGLKMLSEAGVEVVEWSGKVGVRIRVNGEEVEL